ncbi:MAG TPA: NAD(+)/NADH kinase [Solirubrobacteraceae bacterium]|jgi:predicted polyphosphate/ATP-dependent NAD kinase|nr:NAD(+)/NADH kinase [Solirubrobacteraceae bacterium]
MPDADPSRPRLGIIVNPLAGIGGAVALKGSDGADTVATAWERGAVPQAPARASRTLRALAAAASPVELLAAPGPMGADVAEEAGFTVKTTSPTVAHVTSAADTRAAALAMRDAGVELLLFAGGDGTARDIHDAVGAELPVVGIPAGVKMHSGVFAHSPEAAAAASARFLDRGTETRLRLADVADVDEEAVREGRMSSILYGSARVPDMPRLVLSAKSGSRTSPDMALEALAQSFASSLDPDCLYLIGPGSTTALLLAALGDGGTLLGVDAVRDGRVIGRDLTEEQIIALMEQSHETRLIVGLVGGQGALFGRGNRQLGPRVLWRIPRDRITILSAADKLHALAPPTLWVDTGEPELDAHLSGYVRVDVGPRQQIVMKLSS